MTRRDNHSTMITNGIDRHLDGLTGCNYNISPRGAAYATLVGNMTMRNLLCACFTFRRNVIRVYLGMEVNGR